MTARRAMIVRLAGVVVAASLSLCALCSPGAADAASTAPWWRLDATIASSPSPLPGGQTEAQIVVTAGNLGDGPLDGGEAPIVLSDVLPPGVTYVAAQGWQTGDDPLGALGDEIDCGPPELGDRTVTCRDGGSLAPYERLAVRITVERARRVVTCESRDRERRRRRARLAVQAAERRADGTAARRRKLRAHARRRRRLERRPGRLASVPADDDARLRPDTATVPAGKTQPGRTAGAGRSAAERDIGAAAQRQRQAAGRARRRRERGAAVLASRLLGRGRRADQPVPRRHRRRCRGRDDQPGLRAAAWLDAADGARVQSHARGRRTGALRLRGRERAGGDQNRRAHRRRLRGRSSHRRALAGGAGDRQPGDAVGRAGRFATQLRPRLGLPRGRGLGRTQGALHGARSAGAAGAADAADLVLAAEAGMERDQRQIVAVRRRTERCRGQKRRRCRSENRSGSRIAERDDRLPAPVRSLARG